jgi:hypothetical protein
MYPASYIPPLPGKHARGRLSEDLVARRQHSLSMFLNKLLQSDLLRASSEVDVFLRET